MTQSRSKSPFLLWTWSKSKGSILRIVSKNYQTKTLSFLILLEEVFMGSSLVSMKKDTKNSTKWKSIWWDSLNSMKTSRKITYCCHKAIKIFIISTQRLVTIFNSNLRQRDKFVLMFSSKIWVLPWMVDTLTVIWQKNGLKRKRLNWSRNKSILCYPKKLLDLLSVKKNKPKFHTKIYRPSDKNLSKED